jgi:hypothetical protein
MLSLAGSRYDRLDFMERYAKGAALAGGALLSQDAPSSA